MTTVKGNPWIAIADLFSSVVLVIFMLFLMSIIAPKFSAEKQRNLIMTQFNSALTEFETSGQLRIHEDESVLEFTSVTFASGSARLNPNTEKMVEELSKRLKQLLVDHPKMEILIEGHTDPAVVRALIKNGGYFENNIQLSALRAINVRDELLKHIGEEFAPRIGVAGYGETRLRNTTDVYSPDNRRIEIRLLWEGKK